MKYRLIILTHGGDETTPTLLDTIGAFTECVTPDPYETVLVEDGPPKQNLPAIPIHRISTGDEPLGFCGASRAAWDVARIPGVDWIYWLEHDFVHVRPTHLASLAAVLILEEQVAQMSLMRQPVNGAERRAGGLVKSRPEGFLPKVTPGAWGTSHRWMEQGIYWTTNPALFRADIARAVEFPEGPECEGKLTGVLRSAGYSFGVWGRGEEWVRHDGQRTGFGY